MLNILKKIKLFKKPDKSKKVFILPLVIVIMLCVGILAALENMTNPPGSVVHKGPVKIDLSVCTDSAIQPDCYNGDFPTPKLTWKCSPEEHDVRDEEYMLALEIDNSDDFSSPEFKTGEISIKNNFYIVDKAALNTGESYYWRIRARNKANEWTGWAVEEDLFVVAPMCGDDPNITN